MTESYLLMSRLAMAVLSEQPFLLAHLQRKYRCGTVSIYYRNILIGSEYSTPPLFYILIPPWLCVLRSFYATLWEAKASIKKQHGPSRW